MSEDPKNIFKKFSQNARRILITSQKIAQGMNSALGSEHILLALAATPNTLANGILKEHMISMDQIRLVISLHRFQKKASGGINDEAKTILENAAKAAAGFGHHQVDTEHLLLAIVSEKSSKGFEIINRIGIDPFTLKSQIENFFDELKNLEKPAPGPMAGPPPLSFGPTDDFQMPGPILEIPPRPKTIDQFINDLTTLAEENKIDPVIGREREIQRVIQILCRRTKNNPVLTGEPGVGKTAIVEGLAQRLVDGKVPSAIANKRLVMLDLALLISGTMYRGQFEERIKKILEELISRGNSILFIDELHTIVGTGSAEGSLDLANILKPSLAKGKLRLIGATTQDEYRKFIEKDPALERRLQKVTVDEPTKEETSKILKGIRPKYEEHHGVEITDEAIQAAVELSERYIYDRYLPDKAIDLIDEASSAWQIKHDNKGVGRLKNMERQLLEVKQAKEKEVQQEHFEKAANLRNLEMRLKEEIEVAKKIQKPTAQSNQIGREDIARVLSLWTNVPVETLKAQEKARYLNLDANLKKQIIGQNEAIKEIASAIRRSKTGVADPNRPIGSFIFMGPTGVGKTELARALAEVLFGAREAIIKIDMSEFMERHNVSRLVGAPPGYVGYEEAGRLTEQIRQKPYSIILFDEIEKAHPEVFNVLLQILEDGELTDAKGRKVNFRNTIIIMTSNIGVRKLNEQAEIGFSVSGKSKRTILEQYNKMKNEIIKELKEEFRPELLNRLDKIIVFKPLGKKEILEITRLQLGDLTERLSKEGFKVQIDPAVNQLIAQKGFDPHYGARPIRRTIADLIETPLSQEILAGKFKGGAVVRIVLLKGKITFKTVTGQAKANRSKIK